MPGDDTEKATRWRVFGLTWLSYASYYLTRKNFSVAKKTIQDELGVSKRQLGNIDLGYSAAYAVGQFVWGAVADRVGYRRVLAFGMLATAACSLWFGASSTVLLFALAFGLNGLAQATGWAPNVKAMTSWFPPEGRGAVMGGWTTNYQVGSLLANPLAGALLVTFGWRAAFRYPALVVALVGVALFFFLPERRVAPDPVELQRVAEERRVARRRVLRTPLLWGLGGAYFFMKLTRYVLLFWLPYYMEDRLHYSKGYAANVSLAFEAGGAIGALTIGFLSDRVFAGRRVPVGILALLGLAAALPLYGWASPLGLLPNIAALALVGFFLFGPDALLSATAAQDIGGPAGAALAAGIINGMGSCGQILAGPLTAEVSERWSWNALYVLLGGGIVFAALILVPFARSRR